MCGVARNCLRISMLLLASSLLVRAGRAEDLRDHSPSRPVEGAGHSAAPVYRQLDVETLYRRLEAAERRIEDLEAQGGKRGQAPFRTTSNGSSQGETREMGPDPFSPTGSENGGLKERLGKIEDTLAALREKPNPTLEINGRIHFDHWSFTDDSEGIHFFENPATGVDPEDRTFFRRIRLRFQGDILDNMLYRMQIDFNSPADGEMKDMYIGFTELPIVQTLLIGNQKRPLGLDHLNSSRYNVFIERPLVVEAFNEDARRLGIASYGVSDDEVYNWRYGIYLLENPVLDGEVIGDSRQASFNARLASTPWYDECSGGRGYFHWAVAGMLARPDGDADPNDTNRNEGRFRTRAELRSDERWINTGRIAGAEWYEILAAESVLNVGPLQIVGEYQTNWVQRDSDTPGTGPDVFFHGAYVYVAYMLTGEHVPINRRRGVIGRVEPFENFFLVERCTGGCGRGWGAWQIALRYSYLDLTDHDIKGGVEHNTTLGLVWYFNSHASLQFNAIYGDIRDHEPTGGFTGGHFTALGARMRIDF